MIGVASVGDYDFTNYAGKGVTLMSKALSIGEAALVIGFNRP